MPIFKICRLFNSTYLNGEESFHVVHYLDYDNVEQNDFLVVNQMKYKGRLDNSIPDLVV
ncbi:type I restriction endonuclease, partial [Okeania sp. SIO1F9]|uniref:type I restriction endonuclease n=1 Tax=Okeania sp. SIO1F9 TaxID=2607813 RepID=UPI00338FC6FC